MPQTVKQVSQRAFGILPEHNGLFLTIGPASTSSSVGTMVVQFNPDGASDFEVVVHGRCWGQAARDQDVPFVPIPYRIASRDNVAQLYELTAAAINTSALIQIPANWEIAFLVSASAGECSVCSWNLPGNSNP